MSEIALDTCLYPKDTSASTYDCSDQFSVDIHIWSGRVFRNPIRYGSELQNPQNTYNISIIINEKKTLICCKYNPIKTLAKTQETA